MKLLALAALFLLTLGVEVASASPQLGTAFFKSDSVVCVTFRGEPRRTGDYVLIFAFSPPRVMDGWIRGQVKASCNKSAPTEGQSYNVTLRQPLSTPGDVGVAVRDLSARVEFVEGDLIVRTEGAKAPLRLRQCASGEGLHLTAWRDNRRTWHEYWYLGFDLEANCSDEEAAE